MKTILLSIGLALGAGVIHAADTNSLFSASRFSVSPYAGVNADKFSPFKGDGGFIGLSLAGRVTEAVSITVEGAGRDTHEHFIDQFGAHIEGHLPLGNSGLVGIGELGWQQHTSSERRNFQSTGVGVLVQGKRVGGFVKARWLQDFSTVGHAQYLLGLNIRF